MLLPPPLQRRAELLRETLIASALVCYAGYHAAALWAL